MEIVMEKKKEKSKYGKFDEFEIDHDARILMEAEEIKKDPEKMKYVKQCMEDKIKGMKSAIMSMSDIDEKLEEVDEGKEDYVEIEEPNSSDDGQDMSNMKNKKVKKP